MYVRVSKAGPDGGYDPGKVTSVESAGLCVDPAMTFAAVIFPDGPRLGAAGGKTGRIRIRGRLAEPDNDAAVHAGLGNMDVAL